MGYMDQEQNLELSETLTEIGREFTIRFLQREVERRPENVDALVTLGEELTRAGRFEEGLRVDLKLTTCEPDEPIHHYNLACSYALLELKDEAFRALHAAIERGYRDREHLLRDEDLFALHDDPRFRMILRQLEC